MATGPGWAPAFALVAGGGRAPGDYFPLSLLFEGFGACGSTFGVLSVSSGGRRLLRQEAVLNACWAGSGERPLLHHQLAQHLLKVGGGRTVAAGRLVAGADLRLQLLRLHLRSALRQLHDNAVQACCYEGRILSGPRLGCARLPLLRGNPFLQVQPKLRPSG